MIQKYQNISKKALETLKKAKKTKTLKRIIAFKKKPEYRKMESEKDRLLLLCEKFPNFKETIESFELQKIDPSVLSNLEGNGFTFLQEKEKSYQLAFIQKDVGDFFKPPIFFKIIPENESFSFDLKIESRDQENAKNQGFTKKLQSALENLEGFYTKEKKSLLSVVS